MSWTRRSWLASALAAALSSLLGLPARATPAAAPRRRRRPDQNDPGYRTRWIGHY